MDELSIRKLTDELKSDSESLRADAARALGNTSSKGELVVNSLVEALGDSSDSVRIQAVAALGRLRAEEATASVAVLLRERGAEIREAAAEALALLGEPGFKILEKSIGDDDPNVRESAATGLGYSSSKRAIGVLLGSLEDPVRAVRSSVADSLNRIGSEEAVEALIHAFCRRDEEESVLDSIAAALANVGGTRTRRLLEQCKTSADERVRKWAQAALDDLAANESYPAQSGTNEIE
jgi:HEAT repeat protein